jgi:hypothetical protein
VRSRAQADRGRWAAIAMTSAVLIAAVALLVGASSARADSATLSVLRTDGQPDPAARVPRVFALSGVASVPETVYVKFRPAGGAPCAPNASSDSGSTFNTYPEGFYGDDHVNGAFRVQLVDTWPTAGEVLFCIWLSTGDSQTITTPFSQLVTFRGPIGAISASVSPGTVRPRKNAIVTVSGSTETPTYVFAKVRPAGGAPCAPTASSDTGSYIISSSSVNGSFSLQATISEETPGTYLVCAWLADTSDDATPVAGPQSTTFGVASPPPPRCRVPTLASDRSVATVRQQIRAGHCRVGRTTRVYSRKRRGEVIRLSPRSGSLLAWRAHVDLIVSRGQRPHHHRHRR